MKNIASSPKTSRVIGSPMKPLLIVANSMIYTPQLLSFSSFITFTHRNQPASANSPKNTAAPAIMVRTSFTMPSPVSMLTMLLNIMHGDVTFMRSGDR